MPSAVRRGTHVIGTTSGYINGDDRWGDIPANHELVNRIADGWATE